MRKEKESDCKAGIYFFWRDNDRIEALLLFWSHSADGFQRFFLAHIITPKGSRLHILWSVRYSACALRSCEEAFSITVKMDVCKIAVLDFTDEILFLEIFICRKIFAYI